MPICIVGMPFSGISMVARILGDLGLDLGPEQSLENGNAAYSWRNRRFGRLNDEILYALDAAWDHPPENGGSWPRRPQLERLRQRAADVSTALGLAEPWGWADPRNSLTLPFWRELFPDLRVVVCVRHPCEVAGLLEARGSASFSEGLALWRSYYGASADLGGDERIVTDYARFNEEPRAEVERLAKAVELKPSRAAIRRAVASVVTRNGVDVRSDEARFVNGYEDVDLCLRLRRLGYEVHYCHESVLYHLESATRDHALDPQNHQLFLERWADFVHQDDIQYYVEDGLLDITYLNQFPALLWVSPDLALIDRERANAGETLLAKRSRQVYDALKENTRLRIELLEAEERARATNEARGTERLA